MLGATAPANSFGEGLVPFPLPLWACPCCRLSHEPACPRSSGIQRGRRLPRLAAGTAAAWGHWGSCGFGEVFSLELMRVLHPLGLTPLSSLLPALPKEGLPKEELLKGQPPVGLPPGLPPT